VNNEKKFMVATIPCLLVPSDRQNVDVSLDFMSVGVQGSVRNYITAY
jgi:hypothetical protein